MGKRELDKKKNRELKAQKDMVDAQIRNALKQLSVQEIDELEAQMDFMAEPSVRLKMKILDHKCRGLEPKPDDDRATWKRRANLARNRNEHAECWRHMRELEWLISTQAWLERYDQEHP